MPSTNTRTARLFAGTLPPSGGAIQVDPAAGVIRNAAVMSLGPAQGHGWEIDPVTLQQVRDLIAAAGGEGVKVRFDHPLPDEHNVLGNATGRVIGRLLNPRIDNGTLRADVMLGDYARVVPGLGNVRDYLLAMAAQDPAAIGLSAVIGYELALPPQTVMPVARVFAVDAVDFVDRPAANRRGLLSSDHSPRRHEGTKTNTGSTGEMRAPADLSAGTLPALPAEGLGATLRRLGASAVNSSVSPTVAGSDQKGLVMDELMKLLVGMGMDPNATEEQKNAFVGGLSPEQKAQVEACRAAVPAAQQASVVSGQLSVGPLSPALSPSTGRGSNAAATDQGTNGPATDNGLRTTDLLQSEQRRVSSLRSLGQIYAVGSDVVNAAIAAGHSPEQAMPAFLAAIARGNPDTRGSVRVDDSRNLASLAAGISDGIRLRAGLKVESPHERSRQFAGLSLAEICRAYLSAIGVDTGSMSRTACTQLVFNRGRFAALAGSPGDFTNILADTINKTLRNAYEQAPTTWQVWARRATAPDFKTVSRVALSDAPALATVLAGEEYSSGVFTDSKETYQLVKYGRIVSLNWETMINDDLDAFSRVPAAMGQAAKRKEDDVAYAVLTANAAMADTGLLFNSTAVTTAGGHANLAGSSAAISLASLAALEKLLMKQTGPNGMKLDLRIKYLLVASSIFRVAQQLISSQVDPAKNNAAVNPFFNEGIVVIPSSRLDDNSATAWYGLADNSQIDTVEVCFLADEPAPVVQEEDGFRVDGRQFKIRHTVAAKAIDWRGMAKNSGA